MIFNWKKEKELTSLSLLQDWLLNHALWTGYTFLTFTWYHFGIKPTCERHLEFYIMLSETSRSQEDKDSVIPLSWGTQGSQT